MAMRFNNRPGASEPIALLLARLPHVNGQAERQAAAAVARLIARGVTPAARATTTRRLGATSPPRARAGARA